jgi:hypothetical protein
LTGAPLQVRRLAVLLALLLLLLAPSLLAAAVSLEVVLRGAVGLPVAENYRSVIG